MSEHWNQRYVTGDTPWDSGIPSRELLLVLDEIELQPCRVLEVGCGTGTTAIELARRGFAVTALDFSQQAIDRATLKGQAAGVSIDWRCVDFTTFEPEAPFPFVFDRGCYHCIRRTNVPGLLGALERCTTAGTRFVLLTGHANDDREHGPPKVSEQNIRDELGGLFVIDLMREFHFEDAGGVPGPLGWSSLLTRRPAE